MFNKKRKVKMDCYKFYGYGLTYCAKCPLAFTCARAHRKLVGTSPRTKQIVKDYEADVKNFGVYGSGVRMIIKTNYVWGEPYATAVMFNQRDGLEKLPAGSWYKKPFRVLFEHMKEENGDT